MEKSQDSESTKNKEGSEKQLSIYTDHIMNFTL